MGSGARSTGLPMSRAGKQHAEQGTSEDSSELQHTEVVDDVHTVVSSQTVDNVPSMAH